MKATFVALLALAVAVGCGKKAEEEVAPKVKVDATPKAEPKEKATPTAGSKAEVKKPLTKEESAKVIETAIRKKIKKPTGELTKADLDKVKGLNLSNNQLTEVKGLEKLTQLTWLSLYNNKLTDVKGLEKLTKLEVLYLDSNKLADVKGLEKLTQLNELWLTDNPDLTKIQIAELKKALPNFKITHNAKK